MMQPITLSIEERTQEIGREIYDRIHAQRRPFPRLGLDERLLEWAMRDEDLKVRLFRFVDVLPMLKTSHDIFSHLKEYFAERAVISAEDSLAKKSEDLRLGRYDGSILPKTIGYAIHLAGSNALSRSLAAAVVSYRIGAMARRFIAGSDVAEALRTVRSFRRSKMAFTLDILGEVVVSESEAEQYQRQYLGLIRRVASEADAWQPVPLIDSVRGRPIPKANVSVKLSALCSQIEPADPEGSATALKDRLRPIMSLARDLGVFINIDMEHYSMKDLTLKVFREILEEPDFREWDDVGIAVQGYLQDSREDLESLIEWAKTRGTPVTVRLVKGAYWDYETIIARQNGWPPPVFAHKPCTDANFEDLTLLLLQGYPAVHTAIATHNIRSMAKAIAAAEIMDVPLEIQMLYGMGDPIKRALVDMGQRLRIYTPYGQLIPGMAYLVRRLLENTSNESFLRQVSANGSKFRLSPERRNELLKDPAEAAERLKRVEESAARKSRLRTDAVLESEFSNEPPRNYSLAAHRELMIQAMSSVKGKLGGSYPLVIGGKEVMTREQISSVNPAHPSEVVGRVAWATIAEAEMAVEAAKRAFPDWRDTPASGRAGVLLRAAEILRGERDELAAWEVFEVGKGWRDADADITETIDYLEYYAREMWRLARPRRMGNVPGELNEYFYEPKGIAAIISPWNFPIAICAGMTSAAIVTGNTAIIKPAEQSPVTAALFVDVLRRAGVPDGVVNYLPGSGPEIGEFLVTHPEVSIIAFTGSCKVGTHINRLAAEAVEKAEAWRLKKGGSPESRPSMKKVIAEMGGKNALIVDSDADLDEAVQGAVISAFGYQGQKCSAASRIIVLDAIYDQFLNRLIEAARSLRIGPPENPGNFIGPVIDEVALNRIKAYIEIGRSEAALVLQCDVSQTGEGYYIGPTIFADVPPDSRIAQEEIFGPVVCVIRAADFDDALRIALLSSYALTGGVYSRSPAHIERARREFRVGNLYINRKTTGAIVGRQPFGGFKMSGIGSKAGGPDYLLQFMDPRTVTENTMRRGFAPEYPDT